MGLPRGLPVPTPTQRAALPARGSASGRARGVRPAWHAGSGCASNRLCNVFFGLFFLFVFFFSSSPQPEAASRALRCAYAELAASLVLANGEAGGTWRLKLMLLLNHVLSGGEFFCGIGAFETHRCIISYSVL